MPSKPNVSLSRADRAAAVRPAPGPAPAAMGDAAQSAPLSTNLALGGLLLFALLIRLALIGAEGFKNDVSTFEAWALTLAEHSTRQFYANTTFADYPPGYFFVLWIVGHAYKLLVHNDPNFALLKAAVKLPAILMDLVDTVLIFAIVRRFAALPWAFGAAALYAFNPATIFISASWGQVDSVAGGVTLASLFLLLLADRRTDRAGWLVAAAWILLAYSILIKPPAVVLVPLYLAYPFTTDDAALRLRRIAGSAAGVGGAFVLAYVCALAFHAGWNPVAQFTWLYGRYSYAAGVYPYSSINAFNLYTMLRNFWQPDNQLIPDWMVGGHVIGFPQYVWGVILLLSAVVLVVSRYVQRRDSPALIEAAAILSLGYFVLLTRMHERYVFNAIMLAIPLVWFRRRYLYATVLLTITLVSNLYYSLHYLQVMDAKVPGIDPTNLMPWISRPDSVLNVMVFFYLGYRYLSPAAEAPKQFTLGVEMRRAAAAARRWFSPLEGVARMLPVDWLIGGSLTIASFVLTFVAYQSPPEKIFDEIYYARAGEEYLAHKDIFEFTHPPLTKLIITASMMLFGGLHGHGDTAAGWRFLNLVVGALMVLVLYAFAKRLTGSTLFSGIAAGLLLFDGFHFAQARIATPEITVAFFSLLTLYAFYRFWIASQVRVAAWFDERAASRGGVALAIGTVLAFALTFVFGRGQSSAAHIVEFIYFELGAYLAVRLLLPRLVPSPDVTSYADGARVTGDELVTPDGGVVPLGKGAVVPGGLTRVDKNAGLAYTDAGLRIEYARSGEMRYVTPEGEARFEPAGTMLAGGAAIDGRRDARLWMWLLALSAGCLGACKWNGLFDFFVVWLLAGFVVAQISWAELARGIGLGKVVVRPASWGNPFGFSLDMVVASMLFVGATIYVLCYIPYFLLGHSISDLVELQYGMYHYHATLVATHPYSSRWWQWPLLQIPISYYYHDFRTGGQAQLGSACCVAEILALPNPLMWWTGLVSVPLVAWLAWSERRKGYLLLVVAYFLQWLPWIASPRLSFEYHFLPNLAIICLADTILLQRIWRLGERPANAAGEDAPSWPRRAVVAYLAAIVAAFIFWYPVVAGTHVTYDAWNQRMITWLEGNNWINPHPGS